MRLTHLAIFLLLVTFQPLLCKLAKPAVTWSSSSAGVVTDSTVGDEPARVRACCGIRWSRVAPLDCPKSTDASWIAFDAAALCAAGPVLASQHAAAVDPPTMSHPPAGITILLI